MADWDKRFLDMAKFVSGWSKDPSTKCGCVIVQPDTLRVVATGYNGFPRGMCDHEDLYLDRPTKLSRTIHAEVNAVLNAVADVEGCTAYVTGPPCNNCAIVLIQAGIDRVVCYEPSEDYLSRWGETREMSIGFFEEVDVDYEEHRDG